MAGFGDLYHYFRGRSGRRYLFSRIDVADLDDFGPAVAIAAEPSGGERLVIRAITLLEEPGDDRLGPPDDRCVVLVHLLADTADERRAVVEDLAGVRLPAACDLRRWRRAPAPVAPARDRGRRVPAGARWC